MKLPKQIPVKLLYVLLVIYIWSSVMNTSSETKEDFDMKELKNMLMGKDNDKEEFDMKKMKKIKNMLMGKKDDKEEFDMKKMKDVQNMLMDKLIKQKDDKEDFEPYDEEEEKIYLNKMLTSHGSPIKK